MYYVKFNTDGWLLQATNLLPAEDAESFDEIPEELIGKLLFKDSESIVREATAEEQAAKQAAAVLSVKSNAQRRKRNILLDQSDTLVLPDRWASYSDAKRSALSTYRQALRDVPAQQGFPDEVIWPEINN